MLKLEKKTTTVKTYYEKDVTGDHQADKIFMIGCLFVIVTMAIAIFYVVVN